MIGDAQIILAEAGPRLMTALPEREAPNPAILWAGSREREPFLAGP